MITEHCAAWKALLSRVEALEGSKSQVPPVEGKEPGEWLFGVMVGVGRYMEARFEDHDKQFRTDLAKAEAVVRAEANGLRKELASVEQRLSMERSTSESLRRSLADMGQRLKQLEAECDDAKHLAGNLMAEKERLRAELAAAKRPKMTTDELIAECRETVQGGWDTALREVMEDRVHGWDGNTNARLKALADRYHGRA